MKIQSILVGNAPQYEAFSVFLKKLIAPLSEQVNYLFKCTEIKPFL
jgi:hypothetical protein